eukprot:384436-Hanusia_phi.AAC.1
MGLVADVKSKSRRGSVHREHDVEGGREERRGRASSTRFESVRYFARTVEVELRSGPTLAPMC